MKALGVIPARYGSTRLPAKALALLDGRPMIQHVYERARQAKRLDALIVATDDERIMEAVRKFGGQAAMTRTEHRSGTERVAEVARESQAEIIVNIQGDEPLIRPEPIDQIVEFLSQHRAVPMATVMTPLAKSDDIASPHVVKVVVSQDGYALYFSRSPIPFVRQAPSGAQQVSWKHLGLYGYQRHFLLEFAHLAPTPLEQLEQLEQLRALERGYVIKVLETPFDTVSVDTAEDLSKVASLIKSN